MDKISLMILDSLTRGIIILNNEFEIEFFNDYMEYLVGFSKQKALGYNIFDFFPGINKSHFKDIFSTSLQRSFRYFFSSTIHGDLIAEGMNINFNISGFEIDGRQFLLMEFIDITSQSQRINQLKEYLNELSYLNQKLQDKEKEIEKLAFSDCLTKVGNRTLFYSLADKLLANAQRTKGILGLMFIDVDELKLINDTYGHGAGDCALVGVAQVLIENTRETDIIFRYGGDEFIILLPNLDGYGSSHLVARRILKADRKIRIFDDLELDINLSIGMSFFPRDADTIEGLLSKADKNMYLVKQSGGNTYFHHSTEGFVDFD